MITAYDDARFASVTVFTGADGRYDFPALDPGTYRMRARRIGWDDATLAEVEVTEQGGTADFSLAPTSDLNSQLPPTYFKSLLHWPSEKVAGDFSRACANCHQIGDFRWREPRTRDQWQVLINRMIGYGGIPFYQETRDVLLDTISSTFSPNAPEPHFDVPPPPSGEVLRAVIREWEIDPVRKPGCHDLEIGTDGTVYTVGGMYSFNPNTYERVRYPLAGGGHSIEADAHGDMWITAPGPEQIIKFDVTTHEFTRFDQPRIGDDVGSYPHTLHFDDQGRIWYTLTRSNHVCRFDPDTAEFTYYDLPPADPAVSGVPIAVAYGCDVAPDQSVWWSQLFGHMIGRVDPATGVVTSWRPPFDGPRRLEVGSDNVVWVPGYGSGELGGFDPETETWKVYKLPIEPLGQELPYNVGANKRNGDIWVTGSNSDTLIRFRPDTEEFTVFPLPTNTDFTREIEFGADGSVWTCTSNQEIAEGTPGTGRIIKLEIRPPRGSCGDGVTQLGEGCDDGNTTDCDGCSARCTVETGCGDHVRCGAEECDDGNTGDCDGCSAACLVEPGFQCGDGTVNATCGEDCDPPGPMCQDDCTAVPVCGDGETTGDEECDDHNVESCDGCSAECRQETGCGDGLVCGEEECDDGNSLDCDGCSAACVVEVGAECGDGTVNAACGEECDPPGESCSVICTEGSGVLGTRHMTLGGPFYSSALGTAVALGQIEGTLDLAGGLIDAQGRAPLTVEGPVYYSAGILGGQFGTLCARVDSCTGFVDCDGGTAVDTLMVQDSNGPGRGGLPINITTGLGDDGGSGAVELDCMQAIVQLSPSQGSDCTTAAYPAAGRIVYTTGNAEAFYVNGAPKIGTGAIEADGEVFDCSAWQVTDGTGKLAATFLFEEDPQAGDTANVVVLDD
jgi:cysteine-rich repeat protein